MSFLQCVKALSCSKGFNCLQCHQPHAFYTCSRCGIAKYCSRDCQRIDFNSHEKNCEKIKSGLEKCCDIGMAQYPNLGVVHLVVRSKFSSWYSLITLLIREGFRPSGIRNHLALELAYYIIYCMLDSDLKNHKYSILLLPEILIEMDLVDACYDFLKRIKLKKIPKLCAKDLRSFCKDNERVINITEPIQGFCDEKCDPLLLLDLIYVKIQQRKRISEMQTFAKEWESLMRRCYPCSLQSKRVLRTVGINLGASKQWREVNLSVLERQALDLVKLVSRIRPSLLPTLIQSIENSSERDGPLLNSLHPCYWKWYGNKTAVAFVAEALSDCKPVLT